MKYNSFCFCLSNFNSSARCQEIASPDPHHLLQTMSAFLASAFNLLSAFLSEDTSYLG
jgi:hypothetical protein